MIVYGNNQIICELYGKIRILRYFIVILFELDINWISNISA